VALPALLEWLATVQQCNEVLVEAGPTLAGALWQARLVDELLLYVAPQILGDRAKPLLHLPTLTTLTQAARLQIIEQRQIGTDLRIRALPQWEA
jgi:diaminohydroxyphosphoribosylaminopyrimidine deaminase/5-amino-6-(5-phosphoribosylamino)uracil reductase